NQSVNSGQGNEPETVAPPPLITTNQGSTRSEERREGQTDSAMLSGGLNPGGSITFALYLPSDTTYSSPIYTKVVTVMGDGPYGGASYVPTLANGTGTYQWLATYSGDGSNQSVNSGQGNEPEVVAPPPLITTNQGST